MDYFFLFLCLSFFKPVDKCVAAWSVRQIRLNATQNEMEKF